MDLESLVLHEIPSLEEALVTATWAKGGPSQEELREMLDCKMAARTKAFSADAELREAFDKFVQQQQELAETAALRERLDKKADELDDAVDDASSPEEKTALKAQLQAAKAELAAATTKRFQLSAAVQASREALRDVLRRKSTLKQDDDERPSQSGAAAAAAAAAE